MPWKSYKDSGSRHRNQPVVLRSGMCPYFLTPSGLHVWQFDSYKGDYMTVVLQDTVGGSIVRGCLKNIWILKVIPEVILNV